MIRAVLIMVILALVGASGNFEARQEPTAYSTTSLTVQITTRTSVALPGMSVQVSDSAGIVLALQVSDNHGIVFFGGLPPSCTCTLRVLATDKVLARVQFETSKRRALRIEI